RPAPRAWTACPSRCGRVRSTNPTSVERSCRERRPCRKASSYPCPCRGIGLWRLLRPDEDGRSLLLRIPRGSGTNFRRSNPSGKLRCGVIHEEELAMTRATQGVDAISEAQLFHETVE